MKTILSAALAVTLALSAVEAGAQDKAADRKVELAIEQQSLADALNEWAKQTGLQVVSPSSEMMNTKLAPSIKGIYSPQSALEELLKGTTLTSEWVSERAVAIREKSPVVPAALRTSGARERVQVPGLQLANLAAQEERGGTAGAAQSGRRDSARPEKEEKVEELEEIVVTGTHIRGKDSVSPVLILNRDYIEKTGSSTVFQVVQSLPQNFAGGETETTQGLPGGSFNNVSHGSSANLRGLGSNSTLVLVNGHRVAPAGFGQFVDLSLIPLSAVERIEVLTDGAAAAYGSDAVGGVVNVILRDRYEGAETSVRGGVASGGSPEEYRVSQTFGLDRENVGALVTYEHFSRDRLDASDRLYSRNAGDPFDLFPSQEANSVLGSVRADISERVVLNGTVLFSDRDSTRNAFNSVQGLAARQEASSRQISTQLGADVALAGSWAADVSVGYSQGKMTETNEPTTTVFRNTLELTTFDAVVDGALFHAPGGSARLAMGMSFRQESFEGEAEGLREQSRDVSAGFAELSLPIFGPDNARTGIQRLELSAAARYERYSDFGGSTNPKFGLLWAPLSGIKVHATYGKSFRAPIFFELDERFNRADLLFEIPDPTSPTGAALTIASVGNNAALTPEKAETWSAGVAFRIPARNPVDLSLTYFRTDYEDRIIEPLPGVELANVFALEDFYASLITRDPDDALVESLVARPTFLNFYGDFTADQVQAIVDSRLRNLGRETVSGMDLQASSVVEGTAGTWTFSLAAAYLFEFSDRVTTTSPLVDLLNTAYHQVDLRSRGSVSWEKNGWGITAAVNYVDGYQNNTVQPAEAVDSWTTADLQLTYEPGSRFGWSKGLRFVLGATNLFNEEPPRLASPLAFFDIGFDPTNASPLGRFVSLAAVKSW